MRAPARKAATAAMSTAPAARSLIRLICGWYWREIKSMVFSRAVLIISMIHTRAMQMISSTPSVVLTWKYSESSNTTKDAASWICALWPVRKKWRMPSMAYPKLFSRAFQENEICGIDFSSVMVIHFSVEGIAFSFSCNRRER